LRWGGMAEGILQARQPNLMFVGATARTVEHVAVCSREHVGE
jgi:hypothetical protein